MYFDLNVIDNANDEGDPHAARELLSQAVRLGWGGVAITHTVTGLLQEHDRCKVQPVDLPSLTAALGAGTSAALRFQKQLQRHPNGRPDVMRGGALVGGSHRVVDNAGLAEDGSVETTAGVEAVTTEGGTPLILNDRATGGPAAATGYRSTGATVGGTAGTAEALGFRQLTRLTLATDDAASAAALSMTKGVTSTYDLLAVQPLSERVMQQACSNLDVDLITLDLSRRLPFRLKPGLLQAALKRGVHFEECFERVHEDRCDTGDVLWAQICYSPALKDAAERRNTFAGAQALARATRGKGVVISSGARAAYDLRGPADVSNLATLFGLDQRNAKAAVSERCAAVLHHAMIRKCHRGVASLRAIEPGDEKLICPTVESPDTEGANATRAPPSSEGKPAARQARPAGAAVSTTEGSGGGAGVQERPAKRARGTDLLEDGLLQ